MLKILLWTFLLFGCNASVQENKSINLIIKYAISTEFNFKDRTYTVYYNSKPPSIVHVDLSDEEASFIIDTYYELGLHKLNKLDPITQNVYIEDNCMDMPKLFTTIDVVSTNEKKTIQIDELCDDFLDNTINDSRNVLAFLKQVDSILNLKPAIKQLPKSDKLYF